MPYLRCQKKANTLHVEGILKGDERGMGGAQELSWKLPEPHASYLTSTVCQPTHPDKDAAYYIRLARKRSVPRTAQPLRSSPRTRPAAGSSTNPSPFQTQRAQCPPDTGRVVVGRARRQIHSYRDGHTTVVSRLASTGIASLDVSQLQAWILAGKTPARCEYRARGDIKQKQYTPQLLLRSQRPHPPGPRQPRKLQEASRNYSHVHRRGCTLNLRVIPVHQRIAHILRDAHTDRIPWFIPRAHGHSYRYCVGDLYGHGCPRLIGTDAPPTSYAGTTYASPTRRASTPSPGPHEQVAMHGRPKCTADTLLTHPQRAYPLPEHVDRKSSYLAPYAAPKAQEGKGGKGSMHVEPGWVEGTNHLSIHPSIPLQEKKVKVKEEQRRVERERGGINPTVTFHGSGEGTQVQIRTDNGSHLSRELAADKLARLSEPWHFVARWRG
ncbi:hypothetical protein B0H13DRAFT_1879676 [Mycena leptocephala]|nr:hypothetical protein B0H13DRAFT_1879676 [Mycena leptocephala]